MEYVILSFVILVLLAVVYVGFMLYTISMRMESLTQEVEKYTKELKELDMKTFLEKQQRINTTTTDTVLKITQLLENF